jgi:hypothetical protein
MIDPLESSPNEAAPWPAVTATVDPELLPRRCHSSKLHVTKWYAVIQTTWVLLLVTSWFYLSASCTGSKMAIQWMICFIPRLSRGVNIRIQPYYWSQKHTFAQIPPQTTIVHFAVGDCDIGLLATTCQRLIHVIVAPVITRFCGMEDSPVRACKLTGFTHPKEGSCSRSSPFIIQSTGTDCALDLQVPDNSSFGLCWRCNPNRITDQELITD